jgi:hypothetical protein
MDEDLVNELDHFAKSEKDFSSALRYALRIGLLALEPELTVERSGHH